VCKVTEVMERKGANCLRMSQLEVIYGRSRGLGRAMRISGEIGLREVRTIRTEMWTYETRLALIPGRPLEPSLPSVNLVKRTWTMGLRDILKISGVICPLVIVRT
jgi:hypothetical protein